MPLEATQHTGRGALAFAEFFVKALDWGFATTSSAYIRHYSLASCVGCAGFENGLDGQAKAKHRVLGGRVTVTKVALKAKPDVKTAEFTAGVTFDITSFEEMTKAGKFVTADGAHRGEVFNVSLTWRTDGWAVADLTVTA